MSKIKDTVTRCLTIQKAIDIMTKPQAIIAIREIDKGLNIIRRQIIATTDRDEIKELNKKIDGLLDERLNMMRIRDLKKKILV